MKAGPYRLIAGIYSSGSARAEEAFRTLRGAKVSGAALYREDGSVEGRSFDTPAILRLEGEAIVALRARPEDVEPLVRKLQATGGPIVFVLSPRPDEPPHPSEENLPLLASLAGIESTLEIARKE